MYFSKYDIDYVTPCGKKKNVIIYALSNRDAIIRLCKYYDVNEITKIKLLGGI